MGGKSRKFGKVSAKLIAALKNGSYRTKPITKKATKSEIAPASDTGLFGNLGKS